MRTFLSIATAVFVFANAARADIFQWEYIDQADPAQGKRESTTLTPDGAGVDAVPGADLSRRDLTMAYLIGVDLMNANGLRMNLTNADLSQANLTNSYCFGATLTDANLTGANVREANFNKIYDIFNPGSVYGTGLTLAQHYSTASYQALDLSGVGLAGSDLAGANFAGQNLTNASFRWSILSANLTGADFTGAEVRGASFGYTTPAGFTLAQLYSTASYQTHDLRGIDLSNNDLSGWIFAGQNLTNASFFGATLTGADFSDANLSNADFGATTLTDADLNSADAHGAFVNLPASAIANNLILPDGRIDGLDLNTGGLLVVRDYDGGSPFNGTPIPIIVGQHLTMGPSGTLRLVFEADAWDSTISFAPGIPVTLGGTLELAFADNVNLASQVGRTLKIFDWTGVNPTGAFTISSPYAWDTSNLSTTGEVTLIAIPEPSTIALAVVVFGLVVRSRCRVRSWTSAFAEGLRFSLSQQSPKARLLEVMVGGRRVGDAIEGPADLAERHDHYAHGK